MVGRTRRSRVLLSHSSVGMSPPGVPSVLPGSSMTGDRLRSYHFRGDAVGVTGPSPRATGGPGVTPWNSVGSGTRRDPERRSNRPIHTPQPPNRESGGLRPHRLGRLHDPTAPLPRSLLDYRRGEGVGESLIVVESAPSRQPSQRARNVRGPPQLHSQTGPPETGDTGGPGGPEERASPVSRPAPRAHPSGS